MSSLQERHRTKLNAFDCGDKDINDFAGNDIFTYQDNGIATSYLLENKDGKILSFISLGAGGLKIRLEGVGVKLPGLKVPGLKEKQLPTQLPALRVGRLGTDVTEQRKGYAKLLIHFAILLGLKIRADIGCFFVTVDAYKGRVDMYCRCGFLQVPAIRKPKKEPATVLMYYRLQEA